jgi:tetratricopeptide (TPR) repeat protein
MSAPALIVVATTLLAAMSPAEQVAIGEAYTQRGEPQKAVPLLTKAIASGKLSAKDLARAEGALGLAWLQQKKPDKAVEHLEASLKVDDKSERTWLLLGMAHDVRGNYADAVAVYRRATKAMPKSADLAHELGMSLLEAGEMEPALAALGEAVKLNPRHPDFLADHAYGLLRAGKAKQAKEAAELATHRAPDNAAAFFVLADAHAALDDTDAARKAYENTLELDPTCAPALWRLGLVEAKAKRPVASCKRLLKLLSIEPEHEGARKLLLNQAAQLDDKNARKVYGAALKVDPKWVSALVLLGELEAKAGEKAAATKHFDRAVKLRPSDKALKARRDEIAR